MELFPVTNSALSLELLEINLYETVVVTFDDDAFKQNGFTVADRATIKQIISQEKAHIGAIRRDIKMRKSAVEL